MMTSPQSSHTRRWLPDDSCSVNLPAALEWLPIAQSSSSDCSTQANHLSASTSTWSDLKAKTTRVGKTVAEVEAWLARKGFGRAESKLAISLAQRGGDTGSSGDPTNV
jgi:hypothetical protein